MSRSVGSVCGGSGNVFDRSSDSDKRLEAQRISRRIFQFSTVALAVVSIKLRARRNHGYAVRRENSRPLRPRQGRDWSAIVGSAEQPDVGSAPNGRMVANVQKV